MTLIIMSFNAECCLCWMWSLYQISNCSAECQYGKCHFAKYQSVECLITYMAASFVENINQNYICHNVIWRWVLFILNVMSLPDFKLFWWVSVWQMSICWVSFSSISKYLQGYVGFGIIFLEYTSFQNPRRWPTFDLNCII
jgi:hypothetical protein